VDLGASQTHEQLTALLVNKAIEVYAENPVHWLTVRPPEIGRHWEKHGTRLRPPP